jgi:hypothetical protein
LNEDSPNTVRDLLVVLLLVAIGVAGRWGQPDWEFTPVAAAAVFAGFYFSRLAVAALVPIAILAISDRLLPAYDNLPVLAVKYGALALPILFGRLLASSAGGWRSLWRWGICGLVPATLFFATTNLAVWTFQSNYPKTLTGLVQCYAAAMPFYRSMLAGDVFYLTLLFGCWALAGEGTFSRQPARQPVIGGRPQRHAGRAR